MQMTLIGGRNNNMKESWSTYLMPQPAWERYIATVYSKELPLQEEAELKGAFLAGMYHSLSFVSKAMVDKDVKSLNAFREALEDLNIEHGKLLQSMEALKLEK